MADKKSVDALDYPLRLLRTRRGVGHRESEKPLKPWPHSARMIGVDVIPKGHHARFRCSELPCDVGDRFMAMSRRRRGAYAL